MSKDNKVDELFTDLGAALFCKGQDWQLGDGSASEVDEICDKAKAKLFKLISEEVIGSDEHDAPLDSALADRQWFENRHKADQRKALERLFGDEQY